MFTVTDLVISGNTITFTGTGFDSTMVPYAQVGSAYADSVVVVSAVELQANWNSFGIPYIPTVPQVGLIDADSVTYKAMVPETLEIFNLPDSVSSTVGLECSYEGGCAYQIIAPGITASLKEESNRVGFCGQPCTLVEELSDSSQAVCRVPKIQTVFSVYEF